MHCLLDGEAYGTTVRRTRADREAYTGASAEAVLHFDETRAVEPLERGVVWESGVEAETYPSGL